MSEVLHVSPSMAQEAYLDHYGFAHDPFANRVPGLKFFPAQRKPVLGQLHHLARYSQLLLAVSGPHGSGKSLLRQALVASSNKQSVQCVVVSAEGAGDLDRLLGRLAHELGALRVSLSAIMAQIGQATLNGQEVYLLVDDAQWLEDEALQALLELSRGGPEGRAHVFLFGEQALLERLESIAEGRDSHHVIELQPYTLDETRDYLVQRIEGAGGDPEMLGDDQVRRIHERSGGWPGEINRLARAELVHAMEEETPVSSAPAARRGLPWGYLVVGVAVAALGGSLAFLLGREGDSSLPPAQVVLPLDTAPAPAAPAAEVEGRAGTGSTPIEFSGSGQPLPLPLVGEAQPIMRQPLAGAAGAEAGFDEAAGSGAELPPVAPVITPVPSSPALATAPAPAPVAPVQPPAPTPTPAPKPQPAPSPAPKAPATPAAPAPVVAGAGWYQSQPGGNYLVQVLGTRSEQVAKDVLRQHGGQFHYFVKQHDGRPLYVVTYGSFASRTAAVAAVKQLPAALQAGKPWPRTVESVRQEMRR